MLKRKWTMIAGAALITGALATGAAFAAAPASTARVTNRQAHKLENMSEGQKELLKQLHGRRKTYMEQFRAEAKTMIEQAVKEGKITQEEADQLQQRGARLHGNKPGHFKRSFKGMNLDLLPEDEVRSHLDQAVATGKLTREQADQLLQKWLDHKKSAQ